MKKQEQKYMIVASCDPYHGRQKYTGGKVLEFDGVTPICWIHDNNGGDGYTYEEAANVLSLYAAENSGAVYFDKAGAEAEVSESIKIMEEERDEELSEGIKNDMLKISWFVGAGWYVTEGEYTPVYIEGQNFYRYDVMDYRIEKLKK